MGTLSLFHQSNQKSRDRAKAWLSENAKTMLGEDGLFAKEDHRFIWAPHTSWNLDRDWQCYFDSEAKYKRVLQTKHRVDPHEIFTPNLFCVGASTSAKLRRNTAGSQ